MPPAGPPARPWYGKRGKFEMRILCVMLALACVILLIWVWSQRRALHRAAQQLREVERTDSAARLR